MLILSRKVDESIIIGDDVFVSIVDIKGDQVKLGIQAPKDVKVYRQEVYEAIQSENVAAAQAGTVLPVIKRFAGKKGNPKGSRPGDRPSADSSPNDLIDK
jgi:carbon storage regulator